MEFCVTNVDHSTLKILMTELVVSKNMINFSRGKDFFSDPDPITRELLKDSQVQLVYYNFRIKDRLAITRDKENNATLVLYILEGEMELNADDVVTELHTNDSVIFSDIHESYMLVAKSEAKCLGISTTPTQHVDSSNELMSMIETVEAKDVYTHGHSRRVCFYANEIALGIDKNYDIIKLGNAADLHDIGKINVPIEILQKPGKLTKEEFDIIKKHPVDTYDMLKSFDEDIALAASQHHERMDGTGYPYGLKGEEICLNARIIAIADIFDAITCKRCYNEPVSFIKAVECIEKLTNQYDQSLVSVLKQKVLDGTLEDKAIHSSFIEK